jgi:dihydroneopterin aldolase
VTLSVDVTAVAASDDLDKGPSVNYATLTDCILDACSSGARSFSSLDDLANCIDRACKAHSSAVGSTSITLVLPKALLNADSVSLDWISNTVLQSEQSTCNDLPARVYKINNLYCYTVIGLHPCERQIRQLLSVHMAIQRSATQPSLNYQALSLHVQTVRAFNLR